MIDHKTTITCARCLRTVSLGSASMTVVDAEQAACNRGWKKLMLGWACPSCKCYYEPTKIYSYESSSGEDEYQQPRVLW